MRECSETMEQHGDELDNKNQAEEEHENKTNRFQLQVFFTDKNLKETLNNESTLIIV